MKKKGQLLLQCYYLIPARDKKMYTMRFYTETTGVLEKRTTKIPIKYYKDLSLQVVCDCCCYAIIIVPGTNGLDCKVYSLHDETQK